MIWYINVNSIVKNFMYFMVFPNPALVVNINGLRMYGSLKLEHGTQWSINENCNGTILSTWMIYHCYHCGWGCGETQPTRYSTSKSCLFDKLATPWGYTDK